MTAWKWVVCFEKTRISLITVRLITFFSNLSVEHPHILSRYPSRTVMSSAAMSKRQTSPMCLRASTASIYLKCQACGSDQRHCAVSSASNVGAYKHRNDSAASMAKCFFACERSRPLRSVHSGSGRIDSCNWRL